MTAPSKAPLWSKGAIAFAATLTVLGAVVAAASFRGEPHGHRTIPLGADRPTVTPEELAQWGIEGRRDFAIVDLRAPDQFKAGHIRGAVSCGSCHGSADEGKKAQEGDTFVDLSKKLVVYTGSGAEQVQLPKILAENPRLYRLEGGFDGWRTNVLAKVGGDARREAVRAFYAGERPDTGNVAKLPVTPIRRERSHKPVGASEGC
ncbi:MAG: rhodanese-like domain-containing protein [Myxococcaceae bacterium]